MPRKSKNWNRCGVQNSRSWVDAEGCKFLQEIGRETGGYFDNIESSSDIEESVERLDETLSEMGDAEARERRRASRHRDYLTTTTESERPTWD